MISSGRAEAGSPENAMMPTPRIVCSGLLILVIMFLARVATPPAQAATTCGRHHPLTIRSMNLKGVQVAASGATAWALFFGDFPIRVGVEEKIVWRMTGTGKFHIVARNATGREVRPKWGPELHGGSSFHRPGDEWGTGFVFPSAGCWDLHLSREGGGFGDLWLMVAGKSLR